MTRKNITIATLRKENIQLRATLKITRCALKNVARHTIPILDDHCYCVRKGMKKHDPICLAARAVLEAGRGYDN